MELDNGDIEKLTNFFDFKNEKIINYEILLKMINNGEVIQNYIDEFFSHEPKK